MAKNPATVAGWWYIRSSWSGLCSVIVGKSARATVQNQSPAQCEIWEKKSL